jgi:hypothetical protein
LNVSLCPPNLQTTFRCRIAASVVLRASSETIAQWRRQPLTLASETLPASFLKQAEDQTVVAMRTLAQALAQAGWQSTSFANWGVVAAPNFLGRIIIARTLQRFAQEGAWGVSPYSIPHQSLHAISGTISQALKIYGPNFGIGGGPDSCADAFLLGATLLADGQLPGLWLVLCGHDTELLPTSEGEPASSPMCHAVVMAWMPTEEAVAGQLLTIGQVPSGNRNDLVDLSAEVFLHDPTPSGTWRLSNSHWLKLETMTFDGETPS